MCAISVFLCGCINQGSLAQQNRPTVYILQERGLRTNRRLTICILVSSQAMKPDTFSTKVMQKTWKILGHLWGPSVDLTEELSQPPTIGPGRRGEECSPPSPQVLETIRRSGESSQAGKFISLQCATCKAKPHKPQKKQKGN